MKKFTLLLVLFSCSLCTVIQAQKSTTTYYLDYDGSIDTVGCNPFLKERNALSDDAKKFKVSHGSPEFYSVFKVKLEGDGSNDSEGLFTNDYGFKRGYVYRVYLQGYQDINRPTSYKMFIANGVKETQDTICGPDFLAGYDNRVLVLADTTFNYDGGVNKWSVKFSPTERDYNQLWLTHIQPNAGIGSFYFQSIKIENYGRDTEPPDSPSNLQSSEIGTNSFKLTWNEPDDNYDGVDYYKVYIDNSLEKEDISSTSVAIDVDDHCHTYSVEVTAVDVAGNESAASSIDVTTAFDEPSLPIVGSTNPLCNKSTRSFSTDFYQDASYNWSVGEGLNLNDNYDASTSVTPNGTYNGASNIQVTRSYNLNCPNGDVESTATRSIWIDKPEIANLIFGHYTGVMKGGQYEACAIADGATSFDWSVAGANILNGQGTECIIIEVYCNNSLHIWVNGENNCGEGQEDEVVRDIQCEDGGGGMLSIRPNPSDNQLIVSVKEAKKTQSIQAREYEYFLYNERYQLVRHFNTDMINVQIQTNNLPEGFYFLNVVSGDKIWKKKVEIRH